MGEPIIVTNGRFSISIETRKPSRNVDFAVKFDPGKMPPAGVKKWWDIRNREVFQGPDGRWRLQSSKENLEKRIRSGYNRNVRGKNESTSNEGVIEKAYSLSENFIKDFLLAKNDSSKMDLKADFESEIDNLILTARTKREWKKATYQSSEAILGFLKTKGKTISNVEHVGNSAQEDKFFTSDLIITTDDGKKLGVSLKKSGNARMFNTTISKNENVEKFFLEQEKILRMFAPPELKDKKFNRKIRKEIFEKNMSKETEIDGRTINKYISEISGNLKRNLSEEVDAVTHINKISDQIDKIFNAVSNDTLIIVAGSSIFSSKELNRLNSTLPEKLNKVDAKSGEDFIKKGGEYIAKVGIRQDGIGYGTSMKLEAVFVNQFVKNYFTKYTND